jgi:uncharacterized membrane protein
MRIKQFDLILAVAIAFLNATWIRLSAHIHAPLITVTIGLLLTLPLIFFLPGYTLSAILHYRRQLDVVHNLILSISLSMAIDIISGFMLNFSPWGLNALTWSSWLCALVGTFAFLSATLRKKRRRTMTISNIRRSWRHPNRHKPSLKALVKLMAPAIMVMAALGMAGVIVLYSAYGAVHQRRPGFTQLWMVQKDRAGQSCSVLIGVDSFEFRKLTFRVFMTINGSKAQAWWPVIVAPQQSWRASAPVNHINMEHAPIPGAMKVDVRIFLSNKANIAYRDVHTIFYDVAGNNHSLNQRCVT